MKKYFLMVLVLTSCYASLANAQSPCVVECDRQLRACLKQCSPNESGNECTNQCAQLHEVCLNSCDRKLPRDMPKASSIPAASSSTIRSSVRD